MRSAGLRRKRSANNVRPQSSGSHLQANGHVRADDQTIQNALLSSDPPGPGQLRPASSAGVRRLDTSLVAHDGPKTKQRFSLIRARYASDSQLNTTFSQHEVRSQSPEYEAAPAPNVPTVWAPREDVSTERSGRNRFKSFRQPFSLRARSKSRNRSEMNLPRFSADLLTPSDPSSLEYQRAQSFQDQRSGHNQLLSPQSALNSSARSSGDLNYAPGNKSKSKTSSGGSIFRFSRKKQEPLFPLPTQVKFPPQDQMSPGVMSNVSTPQMEQVPEGLSSENASTRLSLQQERISDASMPAPFPSRPIPKSSSKTDLHPPSPLNRNSSSNSIPSIRSASAGMVGPNGTRRGRSATMNSFRSTRDTHTSHAFDSTRNSTASTNVGRNSMAGLRSLTSKLRHPSEIGTPHRSPGSGTPGTPDPFAQSRETLVVPERMEGESAGKYYARLEADIPKKSIAMILSKSSDPFSGDVMRSMMRTFKFYEEPIDMSLRRFLWEIDLPGEAQQIDRVLSAFAERYHECNPHIFTNFDDAYFVAYSLIILHSDLFNPSNKRKMQRDQYQKNTRDSGIPAEILGYFYDNVSYTEFIAQDADEEEAVDKRAKASARKVRRVKNRLVTNEPLKKDKVDPYDAIVNDKVKLDILKPALKEQLSLDDTYTFLSGALNVQSLRYAFSRYGVLQLVSARSRPEAFKDQSSMDNPDESHPGVVNMKIAKAGVVWRKETKKKKGRSPWQEWGAILTQSQLFFFRNIGWVKSLLQQAEAHHKHGNRLMAVTFKPPLQELSYEAKVPTSDAVALLDSSYKRHKHAFLLARRSRPIDGNGSFNYFDEVLLADSDAEMKDWVMKINFASAFSTSNVRIQSLTTGTAAVNGHSPNLESPNTNVPIPSPADAFATTTSDSFEAQLRARLTTQRLVAIEERISEKQKALEDHERIARHLQILAPFVPRTRSELLVFGARVAHNIRWTRLDLHRLRCQTQILGKDLEEEDRVAVRESESAERANSGSVADSGYSPQHPAIRKVQDPPASAEATISLPGGKRRSVRLSYADSDDGPGFIRGIDKAFATPQDTISRLTSYEGSIKLNPLTLDIVKANNNQQLLVDSTSPLRARPASPLRLTSTMSDTDSYRGSHSRGRPLSISASSARSNSEERRPRTSQSFDKSQTTPRKRDSRKQVRRSLHRTLRDSGSIVGPSRVRKARDSASTTADDDRDSLHGSEGLSRGSGVFTVHGKKASVITLGQEWQQMSAEERLRARKQTMQDEVKAAAKLDGLSGSSHDPDTIEGSDSHGNPQITATNASSSESEYDDIEEPAPLGESSDGLAKTQRRSRNDLHPGRSLPGKWGDDDDTTSSDEGVEFTDAASAITFGSDHESA